MIRAVLLLGAVLFSLTAMAASAASISSAADLPIVDSPEAPPSPQEVLPPLPRMPQAPPSTSPERRPQASNPVQPIPQGRPGPVGRDTTSSQGSRPRERGRVGTRIEVAARKSIGGATKRSSKRVRAARKRAVRASRLLREVPTSVACLSELPRFERAVLALRAGIGRLRPRGTAATARLLDSRVGSVAAAERRGLRRMREQQKRSSCSRADVARRAGNPLLSRDYLPSLVGPALAAAARGGGPAAPARATGVATAASKEDAPRMPFGLLMSAGFALGLLALLSQSGRITSALQSYADHAADQREAKLVAAVEKVLSDDQGAGTTSG